MAYEELKKYLYAAGDMNVANPGLATYINPASIEPLELTGMEKSKKIGLSEGIGMAGAAVGMLNNAIGQSKIKSNAEDLAAVDSATNALGSRNQMDSFDALNSAYANLTPLQHVNYKDYLNGGAGDAVMNVLSQGVSGAQAGAAAGPIGAGIGAAVRMLSSGFGRIAARRKAKKQAKVTNAKIDYANAYAENAFTNQLGNLQDNQASMALSNFAAFGGELGTNGTNFGIDLIEINNGGTHEMNPRQGVQFGMDSQGIPNLLEQGETVDISNGQQFVYSDRIIVPKNILEQLDIKTRDKKLTYADASKLVSKEAKERPNDPISKAGLQSSLLVLKRSQEEEKQKEIMMQMMMQQQMTAPVNTFAAGGNTDIYEYQESLGFLRPQIHESENVANKGYSNNRYYAYVSQEGGADTIGDGLKLNKGSEAYKAYMQNTDEKGRHYLTPEQHEQLVNSMLKKAYTGAKKAYNKIGGEGAFDKLDPRIQAMLADYQYNLKGGVATYPSMMKAIYHDDLKNILKEYTRYATIGNKKQRLARNDFWEGVVNQVYKDVDPMYIGVTPITDEYRDGELKQPMRQQKIKAIREGFNPVFLPSFNERSYADIVNGMFARKFSEGGNTSTDGTGGFIYGMGNRYSPVFTITDELKKKYPYLNTDSIDYDTLYANDSEYAKRRNYLLSNWDTDTKYRDTWINRLLGGNPNLGKNIITKQYATDITSDRNLGWGHILDAIPEKEQQADAVSTNTPTDKGKLDEGELTGLIDIPVTYRNENIRLAPAYMSALMAAQELFTPADFETADNMSKAAAAAAGTYSVAFNPIGDYLAPRIYDVNQDINNINATAGATRRALLNNSALNRGVGMAGILASDYNTLNSIGNARQSAYNLNSNEEYRRAEFNRGTNQYNSTGFLEAAKSNQNEHRAATNAYLAGIQKAEETRQKIKDYRDAKIGNNLTALATNLGNIGKDNIAFNQYKSLLMTGYFGIPSSKPAGFTKEEYAAMKHNAKIYRQDIDKSLKAKEDEINALQKRIKELEGGK